MCARVHVDLRAVRKSLLQLETLIRFRSKPLKDFCFCCLVLGASGLLNVCLYDVHIQGICTPAWSALKVVCSSIFSSVPVVSLILPVEGPEAQNQLIPSLKRAASKGLFPHGRSRLARCGGVFECMCPISNLPLNSRPIILRPHFLTTLCHSNSARRLGTNSVFLGLN